MQLVIFYMSVQDDKLKHKSIVQVVWVRDQTYIIMTVFQISGMPKIVSLSTWTLNLGLNKLT